MVEPRRTINPLADYLSEAIQKRGWSLRHLAGRAELSSGGLSEIVRGLRVPEVQTVEKLADALEVDRLHLLRLLSLSEGETAEPEIQPEALYIARRLSELPPHLYDQAVDAVGGQVDAFHHMRDNEVALQRTVNEALLPAEFPEELLERFHQAMGRWNLPPNSKRRPAVVQQVAQVLLTISDPEEAAELLLGMQRRDSAPEPSPAKGDR